MANRAWKIAAASAGDANTHSLDRIKNVERELRAREVADCVQREIVHDLHRKHIGSSVVEAIGREWREAHGFGRLFSPGNYGGGKTMLDRRDRAAARRRRERAARKSSIGARMKKIMGEVHRSARRVFRREGRKQ